MPFEKGRKKVGGRVKGVPNVKNVQWEALGSFLTDEGAKRAVRVLDGLNDKEYLEQYGKLLNYFKPKHQATTVDANIKAVQPIIFQDVSKPNDSI